MAETKKTTKPAKKTAKAAGVKEAVKKTEVVNKTEVAKKAEVAQKKPVAKKKAEAAKPAKEVKVFEAAKDLKISADALLSMLNELNFNIKSRMSLVTNDMLESVKLKFEEEKQAVKQEQQQKKKIQEKKEATVKAEAKVAVEEAPPVIVSRVAAVSGAKPVIRRPVPPRPVVHKPVITKIVPTPIDYPKEMTTPYPKPLAEEDALGKRKRKRKRKKHKDKKLPVDHVAIAATVRQTMAAIERGKARRSYKDKERGDLSAEAVDEKVVKMPEYSSVADLAQAIGVKPGEVIAKALGLGLMVTINQRLDLDTLATIADEFGYALEEQDEFNQPEEKEEEKLSPENLKPRPPVVTVMGHVDHGKTTLLDTIRKTDVAGGEHGSITQHIGAYEVKISNGSITFLDTPGHEAFTAMRARGAQVTDIVILVVAATEGLMPQTREAIDHAQAAKVPIIVAINKIDLPGADSNRVKQDLSKVGLLVEDWGGKTIAVEVSAKTGLNVEKLLEMVLLQADLLELQANPDCPAKGTVIESRLDKGKGILATVLVQQGTLEKGQSFVAGLYSGRVRAMYDEHGKQILKAGPSSAVLVQGFEGAPMAGDSFQVYQIESDAREMANRRQQLKREHEFRPAKKITLEGIYDQIQEGAIQELKLVIKGDMAGSIEAIGDSVFKMSNEKVKLVVIHKGVGAINESDVRLAQASNAIIIGFHVRPEERARELAENEGVEIRMYNIIYDALEDLQKAQKGMLAPVFKEVVQGRVEVRETYKISGVGTIAGCQVLSGTIARSHKVRLIRDNVEVYNGKFASLKRFKDDVREVQTGFECGLGLDQFNDIKVGDVVETYIIEEIKQE
jgi:translation initiation factor IF-2